MASLLLAALLFRAYVPVGFMPAAGSPFLLELCPAAGAIPAGHQHHHHRQGHSHFQNCPFGSAPAAGPVSQHLVFQPPNRIIAVIIRAVAPRPLIAESLRSHQPRGPPLAV